MFSAPGRARVVAAGVEADRVLEAGIVQSEPLGFAVHLPDEGLNAGFAPATDVLGQGVGGGVAGGDHGRHKELSGAQNVTCHQTDVAVGGPREGGGLLRDGDLLLEVSLLKGHEGDHDLGGRGHREPRRGVLPGEVLAAPDVREHPRPGRHVRRLLLRPGDLGPKAKEEGERCEKLCGVGGLDHEPVEATRVRGSRQGSYQRI